MGGGNSGHGSGSGRNSTLLNKDKQARHDKKSKHYVKGKSYMTIESNKLQDFIDSHIGSAQKIADNKYRVHTDHVVGMYIDKSGNEHPTTNVIIVTSKTGSHVYPAQPDGFKEH